MKIFDFPPKCATGPPPYKQLHPQTLIPINSTQKKTKKKKNVKTFTDTSCQKLDAPHKIKVSTNSFFCIISTQTHYLAFLFHFLFRDSYTHHFFHQYLSLLRGHRVHSGAQILISLLRTLHFFFQRLQSNYILSIFLCINSLKSQLHIGSYFAIPI